MRFIKGSTAAALLTLTLLLACSSGTDSPEDNSKPTVSWQLGTSTSYGVTGSVEQTVTDSVTGTDFRFPDGGEGTLTVTPIVSGPEPPHEGSGIHVQFDGSAAVELLVDQTDADAIMVMAYGTTPAAYDDELAANERWLAIPETDSINGKSVFLLDVNPEGTAKSARAGATTERKFYWISKITAGSADVDRRININLQCSVFIDEFIDALPTSLKSAAQTETNGRLRLHHAWDGSYYSGFWWRSLGASGRKVYPTVHLPLNASGNTAAHETGHYLVHVLVGDDVQSTLEGQGNLIYDHEIGDNNNRAKLLEEYAYFLEYFFTGAVGGYDCENPYVIWGGLQLYPSARDLPGYEGFGLLMLSGLTRTGTTVQSIFNPNVNLPIPVLGLLYSRVFEIIAQGATDINTLRANVLSALSVDKANKYRVIMQRSGWQYSINGVLVDKNNNPVSDVLVSTILRAGGTVYEGGFSSIPTGSDGKFTITGEVFPGASQLCCVKGNDTAFVDINIDWDLATNQRVSVGSHEVDFENILALLQATERISISVYGDHQSNYGPMSDYVANFNPVMHDMEWNGTSFSAEYRDSSHVYDNEMTLTGTVSSNGRTLTSLHFVRRFISFVEPSGSGLDHEEIDVDISISNVAFTDVYYGYYKFYLAGPEVGGHVSLAYRDLREWEDEEFGTTITEYTETNWSSTSRPASVTVYLSD